MKKRKFVSSEPETKEVAGCKRRPFDDDDGSFGALNKEYGWNVLSCWHSLWQCFARKEYREIKVSDNRADIKTPAGLVIEVQRSSISEHDVRARNKEYKNVLWLLDAQDIPLTAVGRMDLECGSAENDKMVIEMGTFKSSTVLSTIEMSPSLVRLPFEEDTVMQRKASDFLEGFRFTGTKAPKGAAPALQRPALERPALERPALERPARARARVVLDVGFANHVLRVHSCQRITLSHSVRYRLCVTLLSLDQLFASEFRYAFEPRTDVVEQLLKQRIRLIKLERKDGSCLSVDHFCKDQDVATVKGWRDRCQRLTAELCMKAKLTEDAE